MNIAPSSVATNVSGLNVPSVAASAVPTSKGAAAAGSVRGRAAISQMCSGLKGDHRRSGRRPRSRELGEVREVGRALGLVGLTALLGLVAGVEEQVGVVRELLD